MNKPLFVDFETRSRFDLDGGGRGYAKDPTTEVICGVLRYPDGLSWTYRCDRPAAPLPLSRPLICCAHNAVNFDRFIWSSLGWPEPDYWLDTEEWARLGGLPRVGLDACAMRFLGRHKDLEGSKFTNSLRRWSNKKDAYQYDLTPEVMDRVVSYCSQDVADLEGIFPFLLPFAGNDLPGVRDTSLAVNDRGFYFDQTLAWTTLAADSILSEHAIANSGFPAEVISSPVQLRAAFASLGVDLADVQADTIKPLLAHPDERVSRLAAARKAATSITAGKLRAALGAVCPDSRLRDQFRYHKAHTGRWAGRQFQPHNLAKGKKLKNLDEQIAKFKAGDLNGLG